MQRELVSATSYYIADTLDGLGTVLRADGRYDESKAAFDEARDIWVHLHGTDNSHVREVDSDLAALALARGDAAAAKASLRALLDARAQAHEDDVAIDKARLADTERATGEHDAAVTDARAALENAVAIHGEHSWEAATARRSLGLALADTSMLDESARHLRDAIAYYDGLARDHDHPLAADARLDLAGVLARTPASRPEALDVANAALRQREHLYGDADARTRAARETLSKLGARG